MPSRFATAAEKPARKTCARPWSIIESSSMNCSRTQPTPKGGREVTSPLRKEKHDELTTADIAGGTRPSTAQAIEQGRARPVQSEREALERTPGQQAQQSHSPASPAADATPLFPD